MTIAQIEARLLKLELELAQLKANSPAPSDVPPGHPVKVLERTHGTFEDDEAFREAAAHGRKWRKSIDVKPRTTRKAKRR